MPSAPLTADAEMPVRLAAFQRLAELTRLHGPVLDWEHIRKGFSFRGETYRFATRAKGIFRPRQMRGGVLSIKTIVPRGNREVPYDDSAEDPYNKVFA
ncbi:hypothetical protein [Hyalangium versicolor]|uniref:hypothetical protein n=1 Tax=Hyalangium versicolor TaxID=2861190 RepID=UPI001CC9B8D0|nr:hypothetical protein [Hyalangium versicolor]